MIVLGTIVPIRYSAGVCFSFPEQLMPDPDDNSAARHGEVERLIDLARGMLDRPEEEIVVNYLDHAVEALRIIADKPD